MLDTKEMTLVRAIFLHTSRVNDLLLTLKFDKYLCPAADTTYIFYGPHWPCDNGDMSLSLEQYLTQLFIQHEIDSTKFVILPDWHLWKATSLPVDIYQFGGWISQQFIKLLVLDFLEYDYILIQDCDTFSIRPYCWINSEQINMYGLLNTSHSDEYYQYITDFTGYSRQTTHCLISEFMPTSKTNWNKLKDCIEKKFSMHWIHAIYKEFSKHQENFSNQQIWFSEYELLGNWNLICSNKNQIIEQKRFELRNHKNWLNGIQHLQDYNCVCLYPSFINQSNVFAVEQTLIKLLVDKN